MKSDMVSFESKTQVFSIVLGQEYTVRIEHKLQAGETDIYVQSIGIDGVFSAYNDWNPPDVSNVKVYVGDKWFRNADATIKYFDYGPL